MILDELSSGKTVFSQKKEDLKVMLDTNVWCFIYNSDIGSKNKRHKKYSDLFGFLLKEGIKIYIPEVVILEYINLSLREKRNIHNRDVNFNRKIHSHPDYDTWYKEILCDIREIMNGSEILLSDYNPESFLSFLQENYKKKIDTNDLVIALLSKKYGIPLITDDFDFSSQKKNIEIISFNPRY